MSIAGFDGATILGDLLTAAGNDHCADCGAVLVHSECSWVSITLGCFLCIRCTGTHRNLGVQISRMKSVQLDKWAVEERLSLESFGNIKVANLYAANKPDIYQQPHKDSPGVLVEHWIRAKYYWKEFHAETTQIPAYLKGVKSGKLLKKGKERGCWLERHFMLERLTNTIEYFDKASTPGQKQLGQIDLRTCFVLVTNQDIVEKANCLHILYSSGKKLRSIYVSGPSVREIVEWYYAIRAFQTQIGFSRNCVETKCESYLEKTAADGRGAWRRRWCILVDSQILYYKNIMDPFPKGKVKLSKHDKLEKLHRLPKHLKSGPDYVFTLTTENRTYFWGSESEDMCHRWIDRLFAVQADLND